MGNLDQAHFEPFFNVSENDDKCTIQFTSILLFDLLVKKMQSNFHLPCDSHVYRFATSKEKLKCSLMLNTPSRIIEVSEAGRNSWQKEFFN